MTNLTILNGITGQTKQFSLLIELKWLLTSLMWLKEPLNEWVEVEQK